MRLVIRTKGAVDLLFDGHTGVLDVGVPVAEQEGLMVGELRGDDFRLGGFGLERHHHKQCEQQLQGADGIDGERHGSGGWSVCFQPPWFHR